MLAKYRSTSRVGTQGRLEDAPWGAESRRMHEVYWGSKVWKRMLGRDSDSFEEVEFWSRWQWALRKPGNRGQGANDWRWGTGNVAIEGWGIFCVQLLESLGFYSWKFEMQSGVSATGRNRMNYDWLHKAPWWQERSSYLSHLGTKLVPVPGIEPKGNVADSVTRTGRCDSVRGRLSQVCLTSGNSYS